MVNMTVQEAYDEFILSRKANNFSNKTVTWYKILLSRFTQFLQKKDVLAIETVNATHIRLFMEDIKPNISSETLHNFYRAIKTFFNWLQFEEHIEKNPIKFITAPKKEKKHMRVFTLDEIEKLLAFFDRNTFFGARNYAICTMLFDSGIRRAELCNIKLSEINHQQGTILIHGKGSKDRLVPVGQTCRRILSSYMKKRNEYLKEYSKPQCEYLFINKLGRKIAEGYLTDIFATLKKKLGMKGERISPHTWRHTFAKSFLLNGGDIFSLQKILGHADITTTKHYISLTDKELKVQHGRYNPLDNKDWTI
jgi:site-specific recombinase XerD